MRAMSLQQVFELKDLAESYNPTSLSLHLFIDNIPVSRVTENRADSSSSNVYAVSPTWFIS